MRTLFSLAVAIALLTAQCATALADGGQVRVMQQQGDYQLTVFTSPNPFRAGPADVSILLQDTRTHQTIPDATITIELTPPDKSNPPIRAIATAGAATNKLLRAAINPDCLKLILSSLERVSLVMDANQTVAVRSKAE